ncbi:MAG: Wzt carbohydrate-binding domain-containing protein [archaeon]
MSSVKRELIDLYREQIPKVTDSFNKRRLTRNLADLLFEEFHSDIDFGRKLAIFDEYSKNILSLYRSETIIEDMGHLLRVLLADINEEVQRLSLNKGNSGRIREFQDLEAKVLKRLNRLYEAYTKKSISEGGWGFQEARVTNVSFYGPRGKTDSFRTGDKFSARIEFSADRKILRPMFGAAIHTTQGILVAGPNSVNSNSEIPGIQGTGFVTFSVPVLPLLQGSYLFSAAIYDETASRPYDHRYKQYAFHVLPEKNPLQGLIRMQAHWVLQNSH